VLGEWLSDCIVKPQQRHEEKEKQIMLGILAWIIFGLIAGLIAKAIMPGKDPGGAIITTLLGIVGAVIGGFIGRGLGYGRTVDSAGQLSEPGFLMSLVLAVIGAIILLAVYRLIKGRSVST
jgi:uncharacterized membrane protein YeaQ/YmgE (transglycosylase-associated protein family)